MCGVFGVIQSNPKKADESVPTILKSLMHYSQARGQDSSGVATWTDSGISVLKRPLSAEKLLKTKEFKSFYNKEILSSKENEFFMLMGNCRLATDGDSALYENSQPFIDAGLVMVHNGLVVNKSEIYRENSNLKQSFDIDTEVLADLFAYNFNLTKNPAQAVKKTFETLKGSSSSAYFVPSEPGMAFGSNNGSLYYTFKEKEGSISLVFASESAALEGLNLGPAWSKCIQVSPESGLFLGKNNQWKLTSFDFAKNETPDASANWPTRELNVNEIRDGLKISPKTLYKEGNASLLKFDETYFKELKRCTQCILPETFPFIQFDSEGVCNHCKDYSKIEYKGIEKLRSEITQGQGAEPKIIVALSGGRDSCYALHYIVKEMKLPVIAYTYDWGAVTPLARRNMSLMCSELGVEHILIAADIDMKRRNIRKNVKAWLKRPKLGTVPLFMAGDKQFFHFAQKVKKQNHADHLIFGMNPLERTDFKIGFCGIKNDQQDRHYNLNYMKQLQMITWYGNEFVRNPSYLNTSLLDTAFGFWAYYLSNHEYNILYQYIPWNEKVVNDTLINQYNWEVAHDTTSTWRIGDGTASFYNYIYASFAGFTESDTFRSNQVREGHISRDEAMKIMLEENRPRFDSIKWYCDTMGLDFNTTIETINKEAESPQYGKYK